MWRLAATSERRSWRPGLRACLPALPLALPACPRAGLPAPREPDCPPARLLLIVPSAVDAPYHWVLPPLPVRAATQRWPPSRCCWTPVWAMPRCWQTTSPPTRRSALPPTVASPTAPRTPARCAPARLRRRRHRPLRRPRQTWACALCTSMTLTPGGLPSCWRC